MPSKRKGKKSQKKAAISSEGGKNADLKNSNDGGEKVSTVDTSSAVDTSSTAATSITSQTSSPMTTQLEASSIAPLVEHQKRGSSVIDERFASENTDMKETEGADAAANIITAVVQGEENKSDGSSESNITHKSSNKEQAQVNVLSDTPGDAVAPLDSLSSIPPAEVVPLVEGAEKKKKNKKKKKKKANNGVSSSNLASDFQDVQANTADVNVVSDIPDEVITPSTLTSATPSAAVVPLVEGAEKKKKRKNKKKKAKNLASEDQIVQDTRANIADIIENDPKDLEHSKEVAQKSEGDRLEEDLLAEFAKQEEADTENLLVTDEPVGAKETEGQTESLDDIAVPDGAFNGKEAEGQTTSLDDISVPVTRYSYTAANVTATDSNVFETPSASETPCDSPAKTLPSGVENIGTPYKSPAPSSSTSSASSAISPVAEISSELTPPTTPAASRKPAIPGATNGTTAEDEEKTGIYTSGNSAVENDTTSKTSAVDSSTSQNEGVPFTPRRILDKIQFPITPASVAFEDTNNTSDEIHDFRDENQSEDSAIPEGPDGSKGSDNTSIFAVANFVNPNWKFGPVPDSENIFGKLINRGGAAKVNDANESGNEHNEENGGDEEDDSTTTHLLSSPSSSSILNETLGSTTDDISLLDNRNLLAYGGGNSDEKPGEGKSETTPSGDVESSESVDEALNDIENPAIGSAQPEATDVGSGEEVNSPDASQSLTGDSEEVTTEDDASKHTHNDTTSEPSIKTLVTALQDQTSNLEVQNSTNTSKLTSLSTDLLATKGYLETSKNDLETQVALANGKANTIKAEYDLLKFESQTMNNKLDTIKSDLRGMKAKLAGDDKSYNYQLGVSTKNVEVLKAYNKVLKAENVEKGKRIEGLEFSVNHLQVSNHVLAANFQTVEQDLKTEKESKGKEIEKLEELVHELKIANETLTASLQTIENDLTTKFLKVIEEMKESNEKDIEELKTANAAEITKLRADIDSKLQEITTKNIPVKKRGLVSRLIHLPFTLIRKITKVILG